MRLRILSVCMAAVLLIVPVRAADTLPSSLTNQAFWKMIADFSEPGGSFDFQMLMSNEATFQTILPDLLSRVPQGGVYLGVAPEQNFTYIAALRPKIAFIIDIRRENMLEMLMYKALFETSATRGDFLSRLFSRRVAPGLDSQAPLDRIFASLAARADVQLFDQNLKHIKDQLHRTRGFALSAEDDRTIESIYNAFFRGGPGASLTTYGTSYRLLMLQTDGRNRNWNFLASDSNYQFVRGMHQKNLIIPIVGDFAGPRAMRAIGGYIREHNAVVGVFYVSNVEEYITSPRSVWSAYCRNLAALPIESSSMFIRFGRAGRGSYLGSMPPFVKGCLG